MTQRISSAKTSRNIVAGGFKKIGFKKNSANLDFGGGKYDTASVWLKDNGNVTNYVYDPFNRSYDHNLESLNSSPDTITCFNVLNVIEDDDSLQRIVNHMLCFNVPIFLTIYEGNRTGAGKETTNGYQHNKKIEYWYDRICKMSTMDRLVIRKGKIIAILMRNSKERIIFK